MIFFFPILIDLIEPEDKRSRCAGSLSSSVSLVVNGFCFEMCSSTSYLTVHSYTYVCAFYKMLYYNIW